MNDYFTHNNISVGFVLEIWVHFLHPFYTPFVLVGRLCIIGTDATVTVHMGCINMKYFTSLFKNGLKGVTGT